MRVDLFTRGKRPWYMRLGLALIKLRTGVYPGPPLTLSYRPDFFSKDFVGYILRAMHGSGGWYKGHAEMFGTFVSHGAALVGLEQLFMALYADSKQAA